jgi:hypothetical protein
MPIRKAIDPAILNCAAILVDDVDAYGCQGFYVAILGLS